MVHGKLAPSWTMERMPTRPHTWGGRGDRWGPRCERLVHTHSRPPPRMRCPDFYKGDYTIKPTFGARASWMGSFLNLAKAHLILA